MCVKRLNERPEGVRVSKVCGCRGLVGIEGVVEGVGVAVLREQPAQGGWDNERRGCSETRGHGKKTKDGGTWRERRTGVVFQKKSDADTGGGAREKRTRGNTGDRDGPACIGTLAFEAREGWQRSQGHDEGHTITIGMRSPDRVHQKCPKDGAGRGGLLSTVTMVIRGRPGLWVGRRGVASYKIKHVAYFESMIYLDPDSGCEGAAGRRSQAAREMAGGGASETPTPLVFKVQG
ncbi:hypothetical protein BJV77DRAFT_966572 [Russula vinacea]|nr:hypothetical protein BJV77DRAFT_966572 [Russula vinacea]